MLLLSALTLSLSMQSPQVNEVQANKWNFASIQGKEFTRTELSDRVRLQVIVKGDPFITVLPSWNGSATGGSHMEVRIQPVVPNAPDFVLGRWSEGDAGAKRTSIKNQKSLVGQVDTDTLTLADPATAILVTVDKFAGSDGMSSQLDRFHVFLGVRPTGGGGSHARPWGTLLDVPLRAQAKYVGGGVLCSPTAVSMILGYWSKKIDQPGLDYDVPEVQRGVYDPGWEGTGNWPFNVAFAGSLPGMTGYVTRFQEMLHLERFVAQGVPIAASVSYDLLKGKSKKGANDGHLVVVVGFDPEGQPIINDPGRNVVRMVYDRNAFARAWASSSNTVYVIHPLGWNIPSDGPWPNKIELK